MTKRIFYLFAFCVAMLFTKNSSAQLISANSKIVGKWFNADTGFDISTTSLVSLYLEETSWKKSFLSGDEYHFVDSTLTFSNHVLSIWVARSFTSERLYLTDGTETSTETTEYKIFKFKLIDDSRLQLCTSQSWQISTDNRSPGVLPAYQLKKHFNQKPLFNKPTIFKRIKSPAE